MTTLPLNLWFAGEQIAGVRFQLNDAVQIIAGPHAGEIGAVITLLALAPEPRYTVEISSGRDVEVFEHELRIQA